MNLVFVGFGSGQGEQLWPARIGPLGAILAKWKRGTIVKLTVIVLAVVFLLCSFVVILAPLIKARRPSRDVLTWVHWMLFGALLAASGACSIFSTLID